jgi:competence protein ComEC
MAVVEADSIGAPAVKGGRFIDLSGWHEALETESQRLMVWSPLLLVTGIWTYFSLPREPPEFLALPLFILCAVVLLLRRVPIAVRVCVVVTLGFAAAQVRTQWVGTALLGAYSPGQKVSGYVVDVDVRSKLRQSVLLEVIDAPGLPLAERPVRVLVQVTGPHTTPHVGDRVQLMVDLAPLPRPAQPGAFDYGRQLYFKSIGAVGRGKTAIEVVDGPVPWRFGLRRSFHDLRAAIGSRVRARQLC